MLNKFLVIKWDWLEDALSEEEMDVLYGLLEKASFDKPEYKYYVVNTDEPYAEKVFSIIKKGDNKISKEEVLVKMKELSQLKDADVANAEADELLIDYINDPEIESAFEEVPRWYN